MPAVNILMGEGSAGVAGARIWRFSEGFTDDAVAYNFRAQSRWTPPAEGGRDAVFHAAFLTLTWRGAVTIRVTPEVDTETEGTVAGLTFVTLRPELTLPAASGRRTETFEFPLGVKTLVGGVQQVRNAIRGRRLRLLVESVGGVAGELILDGVAIDLSFEQESLSQVAAT